MTDPNFRKEVLSSVFRRKGADGAFTRLFENLDKPQQKFLIDKVQLQDLEIPIIGNIKSSDNWLLLTTERLVWSLGGRRYELPVEDISDAQATLPAHEYSPKTKLAREELKITTIKEKKTTHLIEVEPGPPFLGIWHVLKNIGTRNGNRIKRTKIDDNRKAT